MGEQELKKLKGLTMGDPIKGPRAQMTGAASAQDTWSGQVTSDLRGWEVLFLASSAPPACSPGKWAGAMGATACLPKPV